jgi:hypothetical protein
MRDLQYSFRRGRLVSIILPPNVRYVLVHRSIRKLLSICDNFINADLRAVLEQRLIFPLESHDFTTMRQFLCPSLEKIGHAYIPTTPTYNCFGSQFEAGEM